MIRTMNTHRWARPLAAGAAALTLMMAMAAPAQALDPKVSHLASTDPTVQMQLKAYISGVWGGLLVTNAALDNAHQKPLICPAPDYSPSDEELVGIIKAFVATHPSASKQDYSISIIAFFAFQQKFPCPA